jgi:outer membrane lipoprotein SlyB
MKSLIRPFAVVTMLALGFAAGCQSPYHADRGALFGGLLGAGTGAIVGDALGNAGAGAAIGAGVGALSGAAIGSQIDEVEARNRALIEAQMGRQVAAGAVSIDDVLAMTRASVDEELIVTHVRAHGLVRPLQTNDLIFLQQQGVSTRVIKAMQEPPPVQTQQAPVVIRERAPAPVIVEEYHYGYPAWPRPYYYPYRHHAPPPRVGWGISFHN